MSTNGCDSCSDAARERNREIDDLRNSAKQQAINEKKAKAICMDELAGLFITDAQTAIREHFNIKELISGLQ